MNVNCSTTTDKSHCRKDEPKLTIKIKSTIDQSGLQYMYRTFEPFLNKYIRTFLMSTLKCKKVILCNNYGD